jgi:excisionase family DNA binding protein
MSTPLRSPKTAADRLGVSVKTLKGYVSDGELRYISVGRGRKKVRRKFTDRPLVHEPDYCPAVRADKGSQLIASAHRLSRYKYANSSTQGTNLFSSCGHPVPTVMACAELYRRVV